MFLEMNDAQIKEQAKDMIEIIDYHHRELECQVTKQKLIDTVNECRELQLSNIVGKDDFNRLVDEVDTQLNALNLESMQKQLLILQEEYKKMEIAISKQSKMENDDDEDSDIGDKPLVKRGKNKRKRKRRKPNDEPPAKNSGKKWSEMDVLRMWILWRKYKNYDKIARLMNRTYLSVLTKINLI